MSEKILLLTNNIIEYIKNNNITNLLHTELVTLKHSIYIKHLSDLNKISTNKSTHHIILDEIFKRVFTQYYNLINNINTIDSSTSFRELDKIIKNKNVKVPKEFKNLYEHIESLKNIPQPVQRSAEWFEYRKCRITASDTAAAIDMNPYEPIESFIIKKCDNTFMYKDNKIVFHGRKYEPIATLLYEHIYNVKIDEFGVLPSDKYPFLGASPDGICSKYTLDNKFSPKLGTMIEIKCPITREIITDGKPVGEICPFYYYCQIQQQLLCCNLQKCDFWQCKISEYKSKKEYLLDSCDTTIVTESNKYKNEYESVNSSKVSINNLICKGIMLEFYPKKYTPEHDTDNIEWKSKYIIPDRLDMTDYQYTEWILYVLDNYNSPNYGLNNNYYFNKLVYWKLEHAHNITIALNNTFIDYIVPILQNTWNNIIYYRKNSKELSELHNIVNIRKSYNKINTSYTIHNNYVISNNIHFLNNDINIYNVLNKKINNSINYDYDCDFIDD